MFLSLYDEDATGQSTTRVQHAKSEREDFGTIMIEATTVTVSKKYRVYDGA